MPLAIPCQDDYAGSFTARFKALLACGAPVMALQPGVFELEESCHVPDGTVLHATGAYIKRRFHGGHMLRVGDGAIMDGGSLDGGGYDGWTGDNIVVLDGSMQQFVKVRSMRAREGWCLRFADGMGTAAETNGGMFQNWDAPRPAIKLPALDPGTTGLRSFVGVQGGGGNLFDLAGSNGTTVERCVWAYAPIMTPDTRYLCIMRSRCAGPLTLNGPNGIFFANLIAGAFSLAAGAPMPKFARANLAGPDLIGDVG